MCGLDPWFVLVGVNFVRYILGMRSETCVLGDMFWDVRSGTCVLEICFGTCVLRDTLFIGNL